MKHPLHRLESGYTLIEMMVVVTIITALSTLTWLNAPSLLGTHTLRAGVGVIYDNLAVARQSAISGNRSSVVVVRITGSNAWKCLSVFSIDPQTSEWRQTEDWKVLPSNIYLDHTFLPAWPQTSNLVSSANSLLAPAAPITQGGQPLEYGVDYLCVGFYSDGSLMTDKNVAFKVIFNPGNKTSPANITNWTVLLAEQAGGRLKLLRP